MSTFMQSRRMSFYIRMVLIFFFLFFLHRLFFLIFFHPSEIEGWRDIFYSLFIGARFDMRLSVILVAPFIMLTMIPFMGPHFWRPAKIFWKTYFLLLFIITQIFYLADYGNYSYLATRLNASLFKFAENLSISAGMVWETYPVIWATLALLLSGLLAYWVMNGLAFAIYDKPSESLVRTWRKTFLTWGVTLLLSAGAVWGSLSQFPLRWSDAFFGPSKFLSEASLNPILNTVESLSFRQETFDRQKVSQFYDEVANYLQIPVADRDHEKLNFRRLENPNSSFFARTTGEAPPNVVIIVAESLASFMTGALGNPLTPSPTAYLDSLIKESLLFPHFTVPVQATARSIFALITGIPDVSTIETSSRNPLLVNQQSILNEIEGYKKFYFLGGSASWGNIRGLLQHNIAGIEMYEEARLGTNRDDVWGVSDFKMMTIAHEVLKQQNEPFVAIIQTSGFHRPYTIPDEHGDFVELGEQDYTREQLNKAGFDDIAQLNSLRFQDYSIDHFLQLAKKERYYENTVFIIFGDHGLPYKNAEHVSALDGYAELPNFLVPLVIHAPRFLGSEARVDERVVSELDIMPTIAGIIGRPYINTTLGRDIFDERFDKVERPEYGRSSLSYYWYQQPPQVLFVNENAYSLGLLHAGERGPIPWSDEARAQFVGKSLKDVQALEGEEKAKFAGMWNVSQGLYYTAQYLLYHNKRIH